MANSLTNDKDKPLAAEYALGRLDPVQTRDFEAAMSEDPVLRASYAQWAAHFAALDQDVAPVVPPEEVFQNIDKAIFLQTESDKSEWRSVGWISLAILMCLAALFVFIVL